MAAGEEHPAKSGHQDSVLLSGLRHLWDESGTTLYVLGAAPAAPMCHVEMSDAGF